MDRYRDPWFLQFMELYKSSWEDKNIYDIVHDLE